MDDLPAPVVTFLNVIGAKWPYVDEDSVGRFANLVRGFGNGDAGRARRRDRGRPGNRPGV